MRKFFSLSISALLLVACSTNPGVDSAVIGTVVAHGVSTATCTKMENAGRLDYADIMNLVKKSVPTQTIVGYLNSTRQVYAFSYAQLTALKSAGATPQLINYLTESSGFYGGASPQKKKTSWDQRGQYYNTPSYQNAQPFAYDYPIVDDWYDSAYEESLSSPFSYDH